MSVCCIHRLLRRVHAISDELVNHAFHVSVINTEETACESKASFWLTVPRGGKWPGRVAQCTMVGGPVEAVHIWADLSRVRSDSRSWAFESLRLLCFLSQISHAF